MKVSEYTSPEIIAKFMITFETYWHMPEFEAYHEDSEADREKLKEALSLEKQPKNDQMLYFDLKPFAYLHEILEQLEIERSVHDFYCNLVVAATGTGKTMVAMLDYIRLNKEMPQSRLLFLMHREEILK